MFVHGISSYDKRHGHDFTRHQKKLIKDRDSHKCVLCGKGPPEVRIQVDHIVPVFEGGTRELENGRVLCVPCHKVKHAEEMRRANARPKAKQVE